MAGRGRLWDMRNTRPEAWALLFLAALLFGYTALRSVLVSFTIDEATSFIHYVTKGVLYLRTFDQLSANHHPMNIWGMWACMKLFGSSELALRLPNLLAHVLYLYASARIALKARGLFLSVGCFLLLNLHPYLLDFFGLARGYGLACGLMMMSLWQVVHYFYEGQPVRRVMFAMLFAGLSAMAHLAMINYLFASVLAFALVWAGQVRRTGVGVWKRHWWTMFLWSSLALCIILPALIGSQQSGSLYFGCDRFWSCMVRTLSEKALYHIPYPLPAPTISGIALGVILLWCAITSVCAWRQQWTDRLGPFVFGVLIAGVWSMSILVQHVFLDVPLPQTRTALFAIPMLAFMATTCIIAWPEGNNKVLPNTATAVLCIPLLIHQKNSLNLSYAVEWKPSAEIAQMMEVMAKDHRPLSPELPVVTVNSSYESFGCMPYYQRTAHMQWLTATPRLAPDAYVPSDYYIVEYDGFDKVDTANWTLVYRSEKVNTSLYRDERFRTLPARSYHEVRMDMEASGVKGASALQHHSGRRSLRLDSTTREMEPFTWTVPENMATGSVVLSGNAEVLQEDDGNFIALILTVIRGGEEIACYYAPSSEQITTFGQWNHVGVVLRPSIPLLKGDVVKLRAAALSMNSTMYLDDVELRVLR